MKKFVKVFLFICIAVIFVSITNSRKNDISIKQQYILVQLDLINEKQHEYGDRQALANKGCVIFTLDKIYNLDNLYEFSNNVKAGKKASVRIIKYIEGSPIIRDLKYNGRKAELVEDTRYDNNAGIKRVKKSYYDDFVREGTGAYGSYYLISGDKQVLFW